jgi:hypothetical protein
MQVMQTMQMQSNACNAAYLSGAAFNAKVMHGNSKGRNAELMHW